MRGHKRILRKERCLNNVKISFPQRNLDTWNELKEEVITVKCASQMKEKISTVTGQHEHTSGPVSDN